MKPQNHTASGWLNGFIGVLIFSASLPATRLAVIEIDPLFLTFSRATIAGLIAAVLLVAFKQVRPKREDILPLFIVSFGVVVAFPLMTAIALQFVTSARSIVFLGLLPLSTAIFGVIRGGERPQNTFWVFSVLGSAFVAGFAFFSQNEVSIIADVLMLVAIIVCGLGYAEGAKLARTLGGWQVISWALVIALPIMAPLALLNWPSTTATISASAWGALAYVSVFSMLVGFIFWYRGLALGGIAAVSQLQLLQPFFGLALSAILLGETVSWQMVMVTIAVIVCVFGAKKFAH